MLGMPTFDLTTERGKQDFQKWITFSIKNEINSYARQVLNLGLEGASGGGGTPTGPAGGVLSGNYPNPSFAVDMATQAELDAAVSALNTALSNHESDTTNIHGIADTSDLLTTADLTGVVYQDTPYLDFDTVAPGTDGEGVLLWSIEDGGLVFGGEGGLQIPIGQKNVIYVKNGTGSTLAKGKAVMAVGAAGDRIEIDLAVADGSVNAQYMLGITAESIVDDSFGFVVTNGYVRNVNTNAWPVGTVLYFDPDTPGELTTVEPNAPDIDLPIAIVTKQNSSSGILYVRMKNGEYFNELHDVAVSSPADLDIIQYNATSGLWENKVLDAGSIEISDTAPASPSNGDLWYNSSNGKTYIWYEDGSSNQWVEIGENAQVTIPGHAGTHIRGGSDIIDGDRLSVDFVPTTYTRNSAASGAGDVTDLTAHLSGINNAYLPLSGGTMTGAINSASTLNLATGGTNRLSIDSSGRITTPNQPIFKAHTTNTSRTNGSLWPLQTTSVNVGNHFNTSTWLFTAPVAGYYFFGGMIRADANLNYIHLQSIVNGITNNQNGELPALGAAGNVAGFMSESFAYMRFLNANDTIGFIVNWNSGGPFNVHEQSHLFGFLLG